MPRLLDRSVAAPPDLYVPGNSGRSTSTSPPARGRLRRRQRQGPRLTPGDHPPPVRAAWRCWTQSASAPPRYAHGAVPPPGPPPVLHIRLLASAWLMRLRLLALLAFALEAAAPAAADLGSGHGATRETTRACMSAGAGLIAAQGAEVAADETGAYGRALNSTLGRRPNALAGSAENRAATRDAVVSEDSDRSSIQPDHTA